MDGLVEHIEKHVGKIESGWTSDAEGNKLPFQIIKCSGGPYLDTNVFMTLGFSKYPLMNSDGNKTICMEFFFMARNGISCEHIFPPVIEQIGLEAIQANKAYLRGDVIGPRGILFDETNIEAVYITLPVYFPDSFWDYSEGKDIVVFVWMVPITRDEANYVKTHGWLNFENLLEKHDPDLIDIFRNGIPVCDGKP